MVVAEEEEAQKEQEPEVQGQEKEEKRKRKKEEGKYVLDWISFSSSRSRTFFSCCQTTSSQHQASHSKRRGRLTWASVLSPRSAPRCIVFFAHLGNGVTQVRTGRVM